MDDINPRFACLGLINLWLPKKRWVSTVLVLDYLTFRLFLGLSTNCSIAAKPALLSLWINLNQLLGIVGQVFVDDNSFYTICEPAWYKLACGYMWIFVIFFFLTILLLLKNNNAIHICVCVCVCVCEWVCAMESWSNSFTKTIHFFFLLFLFLWTDQLNTGNG